MTTDRDFMTAIVAELAQCYRNLVKDIKDQKLRSGAERHAVLQAASCAPGVRCIEEHLVIATD